MYPRDSGDMDLNDHAVLNERLIYTFSVFDDDDDDDKWQLYAAMMIHVCSLLGTAY
jgi:hypothetical protein